MIVDKMLNETERRIELQKYLMKKYYEECELYENSIDDIEKEVHCALSVAYKEINTWIDASLGVDVNR